MPIDALPNDLDALRALVSSLSSERDAAIEECRRVTEQNDRLHHLLRQLQRAQFGRRSEQLDPDQMQLVEAPIPAPGPNQALVRVAAAGVNFIDVYFRIGLYKAEAPFTPGNEGAGTIEAVGPGVTDFAVGDRVAWGMYRG